MLLRSTEGGSIESLLTYLFKGSLIFESLLKYLYPKKDYNSNCETLGDIFKTKNFQSDFGIVKIKTSAKTLQEIIKTIGNDLIKYAFETTTKLRNTTGHNLVWDDVFNNSNNFEEFYKQQVNAIFFLIQKKVLN